MTDQSNTARKSTPMRRQECPGCGAGLNMSTNIIGDGTPEPGDLTICSCCQTVLRFDEALDLRLATQAEIDTIVPELGELVDRFNKTGYTLLDVDGKPGILCHRCGESTSNRNDLESLYCSTCNQFHEPITPHD